MALEIHTDAGGITMPRVIVRMNEPIYDPQAWNRAMKVLEEHFQEALLKRLRDINNMQTAKPDTRIE